jgi:hypothetical protein
MGAGLENGINDVRSCTYICKLDEGAEHPSGQISSLASRFEAVVRNFEMDDTQAYLKLPSKSQLTLGAARSRETVRPETLRPQG